MEAAMAQRPYKCYCEKRFFQRGIEFHETNGNHARAHATIAVFLKLNGMSVAFQSHVI